MVLQAALQAPRVLHWPLSPSDRMRLSALLEQLTAQCAMSLEEYSLSDLSVLLGVCARARITPGELLLPLQLRLEAEVREGRLEDPAEVRHVAAIATQLSLLRVSARRLWKAVGAAAEASLPRSSTADIAQLLAAFARVGLASRGLASRGARAALRTMRTSAPQDVALLLRCLASFSSSPQPAATDPQLLAELTAHLEARGGDYPLASLAELAGAAGALGLLRDKALRELLAGLGARAMRRNTSELEAPIVLIPGLDAFSNTSSAGGRAGPSSSTSFPHNGQPHQRQQSVTPGSVYTLVAAVCRACPPGHQATQGQVTPMLRAAVALLGVMVRRAAAGGEGWMAPEWGKAVEGVAGLLGSVALEEDRQELLRQMASLRFREGEPEVIGPEADGRVPGGRSGLADSEGPGTALSVV